MGEILLDKSFRKSLSVRIHVSSNLYDRVVERIKLFSINPSNPILVDHQLRGEMKKYRSFSITKDVRIIYQIINDQAVKLVDIGTHSQVYGK